MTTVTLRSTKAEIFRALDIATAELALAREQLSQLRNDNLRLEAEVTKLGSENMVLRQDCEAEDEHATQRAVADGRDIVDGDELPAPLVLTQRDYAPEAKNRLKAYASVVAAYTKAATRIDWNRGVVQYYVKSTKEWRDAK